MTTRSLAATAILWLLAAGCVSDASVRLAYCVEEAAEELSAGEGDDLRRYCEQGVGTGSRVVADGR